MRVVHIGPPDVFWGPGRGIEWMVDQIAAVQRRGNADQSIFSIGPPPEAAQAIYPGVRIGAGGDELLASFSSFISNPATDVVHLHFAGDLAPGLIDLARPRGAGIVVSMPDLSWICERGTCIDASGIVCLPAVTPGSCACDRGSAALARRNALLRKALLPQDVIIDCSEEAVQRLVASGIRGSFLAACPGRSRECPGDAWERAYAHVLGQKAGARSKDEPPALKRVLFITGAAGSPMRYRVGQKVEQLRLRGIDAPVIWYADQRLEQHAQVPDMDAIIVYRAPATRQLVAFIRSVRARGVPTFWDVDDLIFDPDTAGELPIHGRRSEGERGHWIASAFRYSAMLRECGAGIASTPEVARDMEQQGVPARVLLNGVDTTMAVCFERARREIRRRRRLGQGSFTVGYVSGTDTHDEDFAMVSPVLADFLTMHAEARLLLVGPLTLPKVLRPHRRRIQQVGMVPQHEVPTYLAQVDLNIAPLVPHRFTNAKSSIKWSEAALVEVPTLASATEPFEHSIDPGVTGLLAHSVDEFRGGLEFAIRHRVRMNEIGVKARLAAFAQGSPWVLGEELLDILRSRERLPIETGPNFATREVHIHDIDPVGLVVGAEPRGGHRAAGERLDRAHIAFPLPCDQGPLRAVHVQVATWCEEARLPIALTVVSNGTVLAKATTPPAGIVDNGWAAFDFDPPVIVPRGAVAELSSPRGQNVSPYLERYGFHFVDGMRLPGAVMARTFHEPGVPPAFAPSAGGPRDEPGRADRIREWAALGVKQAPRRARRKVGRALRRGIRLVRRR